MDFFSSNPFLTQNIFLIFGLIICFYAFKSKNQINSDIVFIFFLAFFVFCRIPIIYFNSPLNPDESMFITGAYSLSNNLVYWEEIDGCTSGPFNFYIINAFCEIFNQPYDYISARICSVLLILFSYTFSYFANKNLFNNKISLLCHVPIVIYFSTTENYDFLHYSSELLAILIISILLFMYSKILDLKTIPNSYLVFIGLLFGFGLFTKLQAVPIFFFIFLSFLVLFIPQKYGILKFSILAFSCTIIPIIIIILGIKYGFLERIWIFYIKNNLFYGHKSNIVENIIGSFYNHNSIIIKISITLIVFFSIYNLIKKDFGRKDKKNALIILFSIGSLIAVFKTGYIFDHYIQFLILPTILILCKLIRLLEYRLNFWVISGIFSILLLLINFKTFNNNNFKNFEENSYSKRPIKLSKTGEIINKYLNDHDHLVVWGEAGKLYIETNKKQGIRWSHTLWGMYSDSLQKVFKDEYLKELKSQNSKIFIDANFTQNPSQKKLVGHESFPELKNHLDKNYEYIGELENHRIFLNKQHQHTFDNTKN